MAGVSREGDFDGINPWAGQVADRAAFEAMERRLWVDVLRAPVLDAFEEQRVELRRFGPVRAAVVAKLRDAPMLNVLLGAAESDAVVGGHLEEALEWLEPLRLDFRVPVSPGGPESIDAERLLEQRGYTAESEIVRYVLEGKPADVPAPPGIEPIELHKCTEGFSDLLADGYELEDAVAASFFDCLPGRDDWRCYFACDQSARPLAAAATMLHCGVAQLAFAATPEGARRRGCHLALLRRGLQDALTRRCATVFADVEEPLHSFNEPTAAARNLARFGFERVEASPVWRPPPPPGADGFGGDDDGWDDDDAGGGGGWDDDGPDDEGPDEDGGGAPELPDLSGPASWRGLRAVRPRSGRLLRLGAGPAVRSG